MNTALNPSYILHTRRYRDTSLIVDVFTQNHGRVALIAKGGLADKKRQGLLQPFSPLLLDWRGRGEVKTLAQAEASAPPFRLLGQKLYCGLYLNELLINLIAKHDSHPAVFALYATALAQLQHTTEIQHILRQFEVELLYHLGLIHSFAVDRENNPVTADCLYQLDPVAGPRLADKGISGRVLLALHNGEFEDAEVLKGARDTMRHLLHFHLGGKRLKSRELFQQLEKK